MSHHRLCRCSVSRLDHWVSVSRQNRIIYVCAYLGHLEMNVKVKLVVNWYNVFCKTMIAL